MIKTTNKKAERGQIIILVAAAFIGLIAIIGLMTDGGILLIEYARLKRGIDAASVAAAAQFRKDFDEADLIKAGEELLKYNQSDATVTISTCDYPGTPHDVTLCPASGEAKRKLVRVTATRTVQFGFLRVIGFNTTSITATSVGEAASIDMVLVIDNSASMAYETTSGGDPNRSDAGTPGVDAGDNPYACNSDSARRCEPFGTIKDVASEFVGQLFFPYDRVAVVSLTQSDYLGNRDTTSALPFNDNFDDVTQTATTEIQDAISNLKVFQPAICPSAGLCLKFDSSVVTQADALANPTEYISQGCTDRNGSTTPPFNPSSCGSSNVGGGLNQASREFEVEPIRQDSFWVVISLMGGPANATSPVPLLDNGLCPEADWYVSDAFVNGFCRDRDPSPYSLATATRHRQNSDLSYPSDYDADDFAREAADFLAAPNGKGATIFSICVGSYCENYPNDDPASGEHLGQYIALNAGDSVGPPAVTANHGLYFLATDATELAPIFNAIASNIFTRISQ